MRVSALYFSWGAKAPFFMCSDFYVFKKIYKETQKEHKYVLILFFDLFGYFKYYIYL